MCFHKLLVLWFLCSFLLAISCCKCWVQSACSVHNGSTTEDDFLFFFLKKVIMSGRMTLV